MPPNATLPSYCVKCGQPATDAVEKTYSWHNPLLFLWIFMGLIGLMVYVVHARSVRKKITLQVPLCPGHRQAYGKWVSAALVLLLGCIPAGILVGKLLGGGWGWLVGFGMLVAGLVYWSRTSLLRATSIDDNRGTFKGAGQEFLSRLSPAGAAGGK